ncbi:hypothetical protein [Streptomyces sp. MMG1121]|uniref:hypothetical protein n=1 Tax=Streptomyces sp. MMG1121 TaxID=1415544 RepID=UPI0006ADC511|nr:hypothetical protein [Streptomyces sp. MMG1121]KOV66976.1 hypothetical protein ADK64_11100 [Streptomyces sp. MMG1121]
MVAILGHPGGGCAGEQITVEFVKDLLRTIWREEIEIVGLDVEHPEKLPVSPRTVIDDNLGFRQRK